MLLLVFLALSIVMITLDYRQGFAALDRARDFSATVIAPLQKGFMAVVRPVGNFFSSLGELESLRTENAELEERLELAESEIEQAEAIEEENQRLTELLDLRESWATMDTVAAQVFSRVSSNYRWAVYIDKGRADGVRPDMAVVAPEGLVGKVLAAYEHSSMVQLLVDPKAAAGARVEGKRYVGTVRGTGETDAVPLHFIRTRRDVEVGDEVVSSGDDHLYPPGIPIGRVVRVGGPSGALEQEIELEPHVDFTASLDYVLVLIESGPRLEIADGRRRAGR